MQLICVRVQCVHMAVVINTSLLRLPISFVRLTTEFELFLMLLPVPLLLLLYVKDNSHKNNMKLCIAKQNAYNKRKPAHKVLAMATAAAAALGVCGFSKSSFRFDMLACHKM